MEKRIVHILGVFLDLSVGELYFVIILIWACGYFSAVYIFLHAIIWAWVCLFLLIFTINLFWFLAVVDYLGFREPFL